MGSVLEGSDKSEGSKDVGREEINNQVLDPFVQDISSEFDGEGMQGCGKVGMETRCSSGQLGDFSSVEIISGREQSVVWVYEDGSVHGGSTSKGVSEEALVAVETEKRQGSIGGQTSQELQVYELSGNVFYNEGNDRWGGVGGD
jgi:hypothetical protein